MPDFRCYCEQTPEPDARRILLSPDESNHLVAANRARVGDPARLFNGQGLEWETVVAVADKRKAELELGQIHRFERPATRIALAQALPKGKLFESIIRRAAEIGIQDLYPLITSRVESKLDPRKSEKKDAKWTSAAIEGAKQSGNPHLVDVAPVSDLAGLIEATRSFELKLIASLLPNIPSFKGRMKERAEALGGTPPSSLLWLVGPEGDFSSEESEQLMAANFLPTSLGPHVMRCETAAVTAMGIARHELGPL